MFRSENSLKYQRRMSAPTLLGFCFASRAKDLYPVWQITANITWSEKKTYNGGKTKGATLKMIILIYHAIQNRIGLPLTTQGNNKLRIDLRKSRDRTQNPKIEI